MDLNVTALVASCPENKQAGLAPGKNIQVLTRTASLLRVPLSLPLSVLPWFCLWWGFWSVGGRWLLGTPNWKQFRICSQSYVPGHHLCPSQSFKRRESEGGVTEIIGDAHCPAMSTGQRQPQLRGGSSETLRGYSVSIQAWFCKGCLRLQCIQLP